MASDIQDSVWMQLGDSKVLKSQLMVILAEIGHLKLVMPSIAQWWLKSADNAAS